MLFRAAKPRPRARSGDLANQAKKYLQNLQNLGKEIEDVGHQALGKPSRNKLWQEKNADEKAEWVKAELQRMSSLFAMLSSQVQEIGRTVKAIREKLHQNQ